MNIDRQKVIDTAQKFAAKGQFDKAIVEYMRIVKEDPSDVRILLKIGDLQVRKGAKDDAIATYSRVALGYDQQGFFLKAIAVYKQILSIDPNLTELYSKLADLYVKLGLLPDALAHLDALASRFARGGQDDKVVGVYRQMVQVDPSNVPCHIKLAELLSKLSKNEEAASEFEAGGRLLKEAGRLEDWAKVSERLLFHRATDVSLAKSLAQYYLDRQDAKRALPKLQVCFKDNAKDVDTLEMLATAFRELGQLPKTISVWKEIARIHGEQGSQEKRAAVYARVLELAPNDAEAKDALRGNSRLARRPSVPPASEADAARKASSPKLAAARPGAKPDPVEQDEDVEEVVVVDGEDDADFEPEPPAPAPVAQASRGVTSPKLPGAAVTAANPTSPKLPAVQQAPPPAAVQSAPTRQAAAPAPKQPVQASAPAPTTQPIPLPPKQRIPEPPAPMPGPSMAARMTDPAADVARIVGESDIFLKYGLKQKAIAHLTRGLELDPQSLDVLIRLRDMFTDNGDALAAARHSASIAEVLALTDPTAAMGELAHALELDPNNAAAHDLYARLGGAVAPADDGYADVPQAGGEFRDTGQYANENQEYEPDPYAPRETAQDDAYAGQQGYAQGQAPNPEVMPPMGRDIEEGLDEAEFFVTQGLYDDARETLQQLLAAHPNHPLVVERAEELEAMLQAQAMPQDDQAFALAEKLAEQVDQVQQAGGAQFDTGGEMIDVESVFEQFKRGVERTVSADDADTHYDLGIAYKEMGLIDDAISEFRIASQNTRKACLSESMIGSCHLERGDVAAAIEHFKRALQTPGKSEREEMALYFELGHAYETVGDLSEAMYFFQKVEKRDAGFRGVRARVQRLAAHVTSGTRQQPAQDDMDEVDRAFDELLKG